MDFLMFSERVDAAILGKSPSDIVRAEPGVIDAQLFYIDLASTLLLATGALLGFVTWFGLRAGRRWAWWAIFVSFLVAAISTARITLPRFLQVPFGFADVPPILWVLVVAPLPLVLGWRGTKDT